MAAGGGGAGGSSVDGSPSAPVKQSFGFITECFFLTARALNLGLLRVQSELTTFSEVRGGGAKEGKETGGVTGKGEGRETAGSLHCWLRHGSTATEEFGSRSPFRAATLACRSYCLPTPLPTQPVSSQLLYGLEELPRWRSLSAVRPLLVHLPCLAHPVTPHLLHDASLLCLPLGTQMPCSHALFPPLTPPP